MHKLSTKLKKNPFDGDKGYHPRKGINFALGNETQPVADARGDQVYGK